MSYPKVVFSCVRSRYSNSFKFWLHPFFGILHMCTKICKLLHGSICHLINIVAYWISFNRITDALSSAINFYNQTVHVFAVSIIMKHEFLKCSTFWMTCFSGSNCIVSNQFPKLSSHNYSTSLTFPILLQSDTHWWYKPIFYIVLVQKNTPHAKQYDFCVSAKWWQPGYGISLKSNHYSNLKPAICKNQEFFQVKFSCPAMSSPANCMIPWANLWSKITLRFPRKKRLACLSHMRKNVFDIEYITQIWRVLKEEKM